MKNRFLKYAALAVVFLYALSVQAQGITSFTLINAQTDTDIGPLANSNTFNLSNLPSGQLSIRANAGNDVGSIVFKLDGQTVQTESRAPYAFFGNTGSDYIAWLPEAKTYTVSGLAYSASGGGGNLLDTDTITITFVEDSVDPNPDPDPDPVGPAIQSLVLINADTDQDIGNISEGSVFNLNQIGTSNLNVRAETESGTESVRFGYQAITLFRTENVPVYALGGNSGNNYIAWVPDLGTNTVTATAYSGNNGTGLAGEPLSISFEIIDEDTEEQVDTDGDGVFDIDDTCPNDPGTAELNGCPDTDGDGVSDINDDCPEEAGLIALAGCPEPVEDNDTDGDGVDDVNDACPDEPGLVELNGCPDADGDGVTDADDACPDEAGLAELNGCPDSDGDGIIDADDECPNEAGSLDLNGCPDSDGDGVTDEDDACPNEAGSVELNGCPDVDGDGVTDMDDECPNEAGSPDLNGCPDSDSDGVTDEDDACPNEAGSVELNGCPDSDGDGVADIDDECPNEAGLVSLAGCPEEDPNTDPVAVLRINCGGGTIIFDDIVFDADEYFAGNGKPYANNQIGDVLETEQDAIYKTERSATSNLASFNYNIPLENGEYQVKLHFAEIYWGATGGGPGGNGRRVFDVNLEGNDVLVNFDLNSEASPMTAIIKTFSADISDGTLNIVFDASVDQPKISAIEIFGDSGDVTPPDTCTWDTLANSSLSKVEAQSVKMNNKLYTFAGFLSGLQITPVTEVYDPATNNWSTVAPMPTAVTHMGAVGVGDEVWILGGFAGNHPGVATDEVQIYNTTTDSWSVGPALPNPRGSGAGVYNQGKIHFFGGLLPDRRTDVGEHFVLDMNNIAAGWQAAAEMPDPRNHLSGAAVNGKIYAIGGQYGHDQGGQDQAFLDEYNPVTDSWTRKADLPSARSHFEPGTIVHNNKIIIVGGRRGGFFFNDVTEYDPASDSWAELCELPNNLLAPAAEVFGDRLIVANGGENGTCCPQNSTISIGIEPEIVVDNQLSVLVYHETNGFRHSSISAGITMINEFGTDLDWNVDVSQSSNVFTTSNLSNYDVVVWMNTSGDGLLNGSEQSAFEAFIQNGGGFVGVHAATDTYRNGSWPWYNDLVGAIVQTGPNHTPNNTNATMDVVSAHPTVEHLDETWNKSEEYYYWELNGGYLFDGNINLLNVRSTGTDSYDAPRPITWYKNYDGGRSFYTALGHNASDYQSNSNFRTMVKEAIVWAADDTLPIAVNNGTNQSSRSRAIIYPNPVNDKFYIVEDALVNVNVGEVSLFGLDGNLIMRKAVNKNNNEINVDDLPSGYYMVTISGSEMFEQQLIFVE